MKKLFLISLLILSFSSFGQDELTGFWLTQERNSIIEIYKDANDTYFGKVVWLQEPTDKNGNPVSDKMNPDRSLRGRPIKGIRILENLKYKRGAWYGTIYVVKKGRKLNASLSMKGPDQLQVEVSFMGMSQVQSWTRTESAQ